ncbi:hypothetical protein CQZ94_26985 [Bacillus sp. MYb209]|nr:hypothetical protein CQZ94_26985 [Bacillus sp. MYb209]
MLYWFVNIEQVDCKNLSLDVSSVHQDLFHIVLKGVVIASEENCECTNGYYSISKYSWVFITKKRNGEEGKE